MDASSISLSHHPGNEVPSQSSEVHPGSGGSTDAWKGPRGQSKSWIQGQLIWGFYGFSLLIMRSLISVKTLLLFVTALNVLTFEYLMYSC